MSPGTTANLEIGRDYERVVYTGPNGEELRVPDPERVPETVEADGKVWEFDRVEEEVEESVQIVDGFPVIDGVVIRPFTETADVERPPTDIEEVGQIRYETPDGDVVGLDFTALSELQSAGIIQSDGPPDDA